MDKILVTENTKVIIACALCIMAVIGVAMCLLDVTGITLEYSGEFILPYPNVRVPVAVLSVITLLIFWRISMETNSTISDE